MNQWIVLYNKSNAFIIPIDDEEKLYRIGNLMYLKRGL